MFKIQEKVVCKKTGYIAVIFNKINNKYIISLEGTKAPRNEEDLGKLPKFQIGNKVKCKFTNYEGIIVNVKEDLHSIYYYLAVEDVGVITRNPLSIILQETVTLEFLDV